MALNYKELIASLNKIVRQANKNIKLMEQSSVTEQQKYPFGTYTVTSPYLNARTYRNGNQDDSINQIIEIVVSYTFYSADMFEVTELLQNTLSNFKMTATKQTINESGIVIVGFSNIGNRDNFISIQAERRSGFDVRIRVRNIDTKPIEYITDVEMDQADI